MSSCLVLLLLLVSDIDFIAPACLLQIWVYESVVCWLSFSWLGIMKGSQPKKTVSFIQLFWKSSSALAVLFNTVYLTVETWYVDETFDVIYFRQCTLS